MGLYGSTRGEAVPGAPRNPASRAVRLGPCRGDPEGLASREAPQDPAMQIEQRPKVCGRQMISSCSRRSDRSDGETGRAGGRDPPTSIRELRRHWPGAAGELERLFAVHRRLDPVRRGTADRASAAGRLARRTRPRHPDGAVRPADGCPRPAGADAACAAGRSRRGDRADGGAAAERRERNGSVPVMRARQPLGVPRRTSGAW